MSEIAHLEMTAEDPEVPVAYIEGEVDISNADLFAALLHAAVGNAALGMVLDLSGTTYLDSAGIRLLFELARRLTRRQQQLRLVVPPTSPVLRVLLLTAVEVVAGIDGSVEDAAGRIRAAA
jgi:anti-sigma B factor antagonist/stage II sporulation protein AA (anti-sigma F factor antagonist)